VNLDLKNDGIRFDKPPVSLGHHLLF
ncbi:uncharacterized protein METZ01_LOCUS376468, partial [marine metagenome]